MKETLLYGCRISDPDYMEEILYQCKGWVNKHELMERGKQWANENGYNRLRIVEVDLSTPPNFTKSIRQ